MNKQLLIIILFVLPALALNILISPATSATFTFNSPYPPPGTVPPTLLPYPPPQTFVSPLPTPSPIPSPTPASVVTPNPSAEAQRALNYVAQRQGIPVKDLVIVTDHSTEYPNLGRKFRVVTVLDTRPGGRFYNLLVDLENGQIEENVSALLSAEDRAYLAKYGKLEPALYERLQQANDNQVLPVAIWVAGQPQRIQEEIFAELAATFPEARAALARFDKPIAVDDPALATRIRAEYNKMLIEDTAIRIAPLVSHLQQRGIRVTTYGALPSVTAWLTKRQILELVRRNDVGMIYLIEERGAPEMDTAAPTNLTPIVWSRGITGTGATIAILDRGRIDPNVACLHVTGTRNTPQGTDAHMTWIASIAACEHATYRGIAPGATVLSAGFDDGDYPGPNSQQDAVAALQWAVDSPHTAPIANISYGWEADNNLRWTDRAFDYWARSEFVLITKSAGNTGGSITSPGKGWNVLTVGGTDDHQNPNWGDDTMWGSSAYINPTSSNGDREKPEVVAPAVDITTIG